MFAGFALAGSKSAAAPVIGPNAFAADGNRDPADESSDEDVDFVTSIAGTEIRSTHAGRDAAAAAPPVIALQFLNRWVGGGVGSGAKGAVTDLNQAAAAAAPLSLDEQAAAAVVADAALFNSQQAGPRAAIGAIPLLLQNRVPGYDASLSDQELYKLDVAQRPDECGMDDYEKVPIESFGEALLRGMGWVEGQAIGGCNQGLVAPVQFVPRMQGLGLGANEKDLELVRGEGKKHKKYIKPGETRGDKPVLVAPTGPDGRVRHMVSIDEALVEKETLEFKVDARVEFRRGPHAGLCGRIAAMRLSSTAEMCDVTLALSGDVVRNVSSDDLALLRKADYAARAHKRPQPLATSTPSLPAGVTSSSSLSSTSSTLARRSGDPALDEPPGKRPATPPPRHWLRCNLRVRIVSDRVLKGKLYNKKVLIQDVVAPGVCVCQTEDGKLVEDIKEKYLETVVPKQLGAVVMIVHGSQAGKRARLMDKSSASERATVQLMGEQALLQFPYNDICEYVGEGADQLNDF